MQHETARKSKLCPSAGQPLDMALWGGGGRGQVAAANLPAQTLALLGKGGLAAAPVLLPTLWKIQFIIPTVVKQECLIR